MAKPSKAWIYELIPALLMVTQGEARMNEKEKAQLTITTATIESVDTPFVRTSEHRFTAQKVAARLMQVHDKAHRAVRCKKGKNPTRIDVTHGDVDVSR